MDEQRARLEQKMDEQGARLEQKMDEQYAHLDQKMDEQRARLEQKMDEQGARLDQKMDEQRARLDQKMDEQRAHFDHRLDKLTAIIIDQGNALRDALNQHTLRTTEALLEQSRILNSSLQIQSTETKTFNNDFSRRIDNQTWRLVTYVTGFGIVLSSAIYYIVSHVR
jgi:hypothetical protein